MVARTRWHKILNVCILSLGWLVLGLLNGAETTGIRAQESPPADERVGRTSPIRAVTPVNQVLTPFGRQVDLEGLRPQALALSPDGRLLVVSGKTSEIVVLDPELGAVRQRIPFPKPQDAKIPPGSSPNILKPDESGQVSYTGLLFSADASRIYVSDVNGAIQVFAATPDGVLSVQETIVLPAANAPRRQAEIPSGLALSPDGKRLYVCGNLSNQLLELDVESGQVVRTFPVGVAPYAVVLVNDKAFVSNWGGRRPEAGDLTGPAGRGTEVRVDPVRHIASEGSVSIVPLTGSANPAEVVVGRHASGLAVAPDGRHVVCCNAASDTLSVIDVVTEQLIETVWVKHRPSDLLGASPNAICFDASGQRLYVASGTQNAIAVLHFDPEERGDSQLLGLIPVGWFPGAIVLDEQRHSVYVANIKGLPITPKADGETGRPGFNSHHYHGTVSLVPIPKDSVLSGLSEIVQRNLRRKAILETALPPREHQPPRAIPERIGEPSLIQHVVYIIKENRTYDQIFGALGRGRGRPELCVFGEPITPNQHKLVRDFVLLDNTYCAGILSADGHQWSTTAFATDYMEKSFAGFPRSYPDGMGEDESDALAYSPAGFIWDNAASGGKSIRNYGEFMVPAIRWRDSNRKGTPDFLACYRTWQEGTWKTGGGDVVFASTPAIASIRPYSPSAYVGWEMAVPDQYRADFILRELQEYEARGEFPNLVIICLPNDHTSGTSPGSPTPAACVADNDLAFGRIVEALSHSRFWPQLAILAIEDDPQAGWDHVSGYRTTAYCISPYARRGALVSTQYNTTSILRTIEQILGLPPMNQFDASATPMFACFTDTPDLRPFDAVPSNVPLDQLNPDPKDVSDARLRADAIVSAQLNFREIDKAPEDVLNQILWRAQRGSQVPYPAWAAGVEDDDEDQDEVTDKGEGDD